MGTETEVRLFGGDQVDGKSNLAIDPKKSDHSPLVDEVGVVVDRQDWFAGDLGDYLVAFVAGSVGDEESLAGWRYGSTLFDVDYFNLACTYGFVLKYGKGSSPIFGDLGTDCKGVLIKGGVGLFRPIDKFDKIVEKGRIYLIFKEFLLVGGSWGND